MKFILGLVAVFALIGCGEQAPKEGMIDAPESSAKSADTMKARGMSDGEIATRGSRDSRGK